MFKLRISFHSTLIKRRVKITYQTVCKKKQRGQKTMNKDYLKYATILWAIAIPCLFAGIMVEHWAFEAIAALLFIAGYVLLFVIPESDSHGKKPRQKNKQTED
jgi:hypothetical protein